MKKKVSLGLVVAFVLSFSGMALAAEYTPFTSVPSNHWAYQSVNKLVKAGLIDGYGDKDFRGDKAITRYEMATLVAKAMANVDKADAGNKAELDKLKGEFSTELQSLGIRVAKLEKNAANFKWYGDARVRYQNNYNNTAVDGEKQNRIQDRLRLGLYGDITDNLSVEGRIKFEDTRSDTNTAAGQSTLHSDKSNHGSGAIDLIGLHWNKGASSVSAGRISVTLGQGLLWSDNAVDGIYATQKFGNAALSAGFGNLTAENWKDYSMNAFLANLAINTSKSTTFTASHLKTNGSGKQNEVWTYKPGTKNWIDAGGYKLDQYAYGVNTNLQDNLTLLVEGVSNKASNLPKDAQKNGLWSKLTYGHQDWYKEGTYQVYLEYMKLGNYAVDSTGWGHALNVAGGNGIGGDGAKGWGVGVSYMLAKQTNLEMNYYKLKPYDESKAGFNSYAPAYTAAVTFSF